MPKMVLTAVYVSIDSNELSEYGTKAELAMQVDEKDVTTFASLGWKEMLGGLGSGSMSLTFLQDTSAAAIDDIVWPLFIARVPVPFELRTTQDAMGTSNPAWTGLVLPSKWNPLSGSVGDVDTSDVQWPTSGLVTRATA